MNNTPNTVFIDTDVFVAFIKQNDSNHKRAAKIFTLIKAKPVLFFTSNYVFSEAITVISQRVGRSTALRYISQMKSPRSQFSIVWLREEIENLAIEKYKQQKSKNVSFVDCTNMAIVDLYRLDFIFSFDAIYKKNGYKLAG